MVEMVEILDGRLGKRSVERVRYVIGERAKRARHSLVCSIENRGYKYILEKWFPLWGERAHS